MIWNIAAPFLRIQSDLGGENQVRWIDDFCEGNRHQFRKIYSPTRSGDDWHIRRSRSSSFSQWVRHWEHAGRALRDADGVITVFPQLAAAVSGRQSVRLNRIPHVAWCFNVGKLPTGAKKFAVQKLLRHVSRFVVHSRGECHVIAEYLDISPDLVQFVPFQRGELPVYSEEDRSNPFIVSLGSAHRDYKTLLEALSLVKAPTVIVAAARAMENLILPPHVTHLEGLSASDCYRLIQRARFVVVALNETVTAAGQVTVVDAMALGRAVVATTNVGTVDYVVDQNTGLLVPPGDPVALSEAIGRLWDDPDLARRYGAEGASFAKRELSDPVAGRNLLQVLDSVTRGGA